MLAPRGDTTYIHGPFPKLPTADQLDHLPDAHPWSEESSTKDRSTDELDHLCYGHGEHNIEGQSQEQPWHRQPGQTTADLGQSPILRGNLRAPATNKATAGAKRAKRAEAAKRPPKKGYDDAASALSPKTWLPLANASQENEASGVDTQALTPCTGQRIFPPPSWLQAVDPGSVEQALRQAAQARSIGNNNAEAQQTAIDSIVRLKNGIQEWHDLWIMMLHNFDSTPYDLFTWGLREPDQAQKPDLYRQLNHILPHPLWQGDICRLRYALQKAISFRVAGHLEPLGPLPPKMVVAITSTQLPTADRATLALNLWHSVKLGTGHVDGCFIDELKSQVEAGTRSKYGQPHSDDTLFVLSIKDIQAVWQALDTMALKDYFAHLTVVSYFEIYNSHRRTKCNQLAPFDKTTLERWDRWSMMIRHFDEIGGQPDYPWMERETYKHLSYWDTNTCDSRFRYCIHSCIPSIPRVIEEADNSRQASVSHVTKKVKSKSGVIHVTVSDDDVDDSDDVHDHDGEVQQEAGKEQSSPSPRARFCLSVDDILRGAGI
ncbi:hypothetical protein G7054_g5730 [Neopestalotiopsis clavispora]|nr:hypothetical protein G7054_g5730 [Neopestalotiopsis clavispora]